ncbi:MAG: hypothetical protein ACOYJZ_11270 [Acutalibacter sp.]|jgi:membrane protein implicated in regulation of membrane protease activity
MNVLVPIIIALAGLILIFSLSKENKVFILAGGYFLVLAGWMAADRLWPDAKVFAGPWGIGFRVITAAVLVVLVVVFAREYRKKGEDSSEHSKSSKSSKDSSKSKNPKNIHKDDSGLF